jgi:hypothetical protein
MRLQSALEDRGAVDDEVMRRDGRRRARRVCAHDIQRLRRGGVLDHHLETGMTLKQRQQAVLHERRLPIEDIDLGIGGFAVDQHRHPDLFHALQHRRQRRDIGDAMMRVGGGAGGIQLRRDPHALGMAALDFVGRGRVGEITRHQRLKVGALRTRRQNAFAIGAGQPRWLSAAPDSA